MAITSLFSSSSSGLLGVLQGGRANVIGVSSSLLAASFDAKATQSALRAINSAASSSAFSISSSTQDLAASSLPSVGEESGYSLNRRVNEIRQDPTFIDLNDPRLDAVEFDADKKATFALTIALDRLKALAELAADRDTTDSTRSQIDTLFRKGIEEVQTYLATAETDLLSLQYGSRASRVESSISLGKDAVDYYGEAITSSSSTALDGLTGTETFSIALSNSASGVSDTIAIDLSQVTGDLSLDNIVSYINTQISAVQATDTNGDLVTDSNGDPVSRYSTQFKVNTSGGQSGIVVDSTLTEDVSLTATSTSPGLVVASTFDPVDTSANERVRVNTFGNLSGTITDQDVFSFAGTDVDATLLLDETGKTLIPDREVDPAIAARRDQLRKDAEAEQAANSTLTDTEATTQAETVATLIDTEEGVDVSVTNITNDTRVQADTSAGGVAVDSFGNTYVVGQSTGAFGSELNTASSQDVFLTKLDARGSVIFSRLLGAADSASGFAVTVDASDNVIVAGQTDSPLVTTDLVDTKDAFVAKFSSAGDEVFRYQLDTFGTTSGLALTTDSTGDVFVGGSSSGAISSGSSFSGVTDGLLLQLDGTTGALEASTLIGGSGRDSIKALAFNDSGELLIGLEESGSAVLRKRSTTDLTTDLASIELGSLGSAGSLTGLAVDGTSVYLAGTAANSALTASGSITPTNSESGSQDGFLSGITDAGTSFSASFTTFLGTTGADTVVGVTANSGSVYVAGTTAQTLSGETSVGATDSFVSRINGTTGAVEDTQQFGTAFASTKAAGVAFTDKGNSVLSVLGLPSGELNSSQSRSITDQTSARVGDFFTLEVDGKSTDITIESGDTFIDIRRKVRVAALGQIKVTVSSASTGDGEDLRLEAIKGQSAFTLKAGTNGKDALAKLGMDAGTILPTDQLFKDLDDPDAPLGGAFGLGIDLPINISDITNATFALEQIDSAINQVGRAFRSLTPNPLASLLNDPLANVGPAPERIANQIANFQSGLERLQASNVSTGLSLFA